MLTGSCSPASLSRPCGRCTCARPGHRGQLSPLHSTRRPEHCRWAPPTAHSTRTSPPRSACCPASPRPRHWDLTSPQLARPRATCRRRAPSAACLVTLVTYPGRPRPDTRPAGHTPRILRRIWGQDYGLVMRSFARRLHIPLALIAGIVLAAAVSISVALLVTPMQQVSLAGQTVGVGAARPTLSQSGPGELDLFGQRLPTTIQFAGPVRPRLALTHITLNRQLATAFVPHRPSPVRAIGDALASGWTRYFGWEIAITAGCALLLTGALAGWLRLSGKRTLALLAVGLVVTEAGNLGGIMATAYTAPARLRPVTSITAPAARSPLPPVPDAPGPPRPRVP